MPFYVGAKEPIDSNCQYYFIEKHRPGSTNPNASIWSVKLNVELQLCKESINNDFRDGTENHSWNVLNKDGKLSTVGNNNQGKVLYIAKFIESSDKKEWHGYPADYIRNNQDKPTNTVLEKLEIDGKLTKSQKSKISRGKPL